MLHNESPNDDALLLDQLEEEQRQLELPGIEKAPIELNAKRYNNYLFPHHRTKNLESVRVFKVGNGKLSIHPNVSHAAPTASALKTLAALCVLNISKGCASADTPFTMREIAKLLKTSMQGRFAHRILRDLEALHLTNVMWETSFQDHEGTRKSIKRFYFIESFDHEEYKKRLEKGTLFSGTYRVRLNHDLYLSLMYGTRTFLNLDALLAFKSEHAEILYVRIDSILALERYRDAPLELLSTTILEWLSLAKLEPYRKLSRRRTLLRTLAKELTGKLLSTGRRLNVTLLPAANETDYKLRFETEAPPEAPLRYLPVVETDQDRISYLADLIGEATRELENRRYHEKLAKHYPGDVILQAIALLRQEPPENMRSRGAVFSHKLRQVIEARGMRWIKEDEQQELELP